MAALMTMGGRVVLVRHRAGERTYHLLPGGGVDFGETMAAALAREVAEETGLVVSVGPPVVLSDTIDPSGRRHIVNVTFLARIEGGALTDSPRDPRVEAVDLVEPAQLASLDLRPPVAPELVEALKAGDAARAVYVGARFSPERS